MITTFPVLGTSVPKKQQLYIIDLFELKLAEITSDYSNLWNLVATGATGLVNLTKCSTEGTVVTRLLNQNRIRKSLTIMPLDKEYTSSYFMNSPDPVIPLVLNNKTPAGNIFKIKAGEYLSNNLQNPRRKSSPETCHPNKYLLYDDLVGLILKTTDFKTTLLLASFASECVDPRIKDVGLGAVVLKGIGFNKGVLYSPSTRKKGIITFQDLKSTVMRFTDHEAAVFFQLKDKPGDWLDVAKSQTELVQNYLVRWPLLTVYGYLLLGLLGVLVLGMIFHFHNYQIKTIVWFYFFLLAAPAAFLLMALFNPLDWTKIILYILTITGSLFFLCYILAGKDPAPTLVWLSFLTVGLILIDGLFNGFLQYKSLLGYSAISGTRYYGIGNEYMGILLGAYIAGMSLSISKFGPWRRTILWTAAFLICMILVHPAFGADVGGGISALMGLGITNYLWLGQPVKFKEIIRLGILTALALTLAAIWDLSLYRENMSHWGQLLIAIHSRGWKAFQTIAIRKLEMNLRLITTTPLTIFLIVILLAIPILYRYPPPSTKKLKEKYPDLISGFTGLTITALIGFFVNDSGIVSAAMIFMFGIGMIALVINEELGSICNDISP